MNSLISHGILFFVSLTVVVLMLAIFGILGIHAIQRYRSLYRIKAERKGETFSDFKSSFADQSIDERILQSVFKTLSGNIALVPAMPVRASDSLQDVYGIDGFSGTEMVELVDMVAAQSGLEVNYTTLSKPPCTVADLVQLMARAVPPGVPAYRPTPLASLDRALIFTRQAHFSK